jgi:hypothetical protein
MRDNGRKEKTKGLKKVGEIMEEKEREEKRTKRRKYER